MLRELVARVRRNPSDIVVLATAISAIVVGTTYVNRATIEGLLHRDAERAAGNMSQFLAASLPDLNTLMEGGKLSEKSLELLEFGRVAAQVERYELYNSKGDVVLEFEEPGEEGAEEGGAGEHEEENLKEHKPAEFASILAGNPHVESSEVTQEGKRIFQSEGYAAIKKDGQVQGILEVYLDQTAKKADFESAVGWSILAALSVLLAGLAVPVWLYRRRLREKQVVEDRVRYLTEYDDLTGLLNRASLQDRLIATLDDIKKEDGAKAALMSIDVDRFKEINESHGHAGGDAILKSIGERLSLIIGQSGYVARFGGDEFAVLMPSVHAARRSKHSRASLYRAWRGLTRYSATTS